MVFKTFTDEVSLVNY